jgi:hypothetical protein
MLEFSQEASTIKVPPNSKANPAGFLARFVFCVGENKAKMCIPKFKGLTESNYQYRPLQGNPR